MKETPANTGSTPEIESIAKHYGFNLFGDPQLIEMVSAGKALLDDVHTRQTPRWLSLMGSSGVGKTYLAKRLGRTVKAMLHQQRGEFHPPTFEFAYWPDRVDRIRGGEYHLVTDLIDVDVLVLDEIGAESVTPLAIEKLCRLFNGRLGKWTILTGNITPEALGNIDNRLASRLFRDQNAVLTIKTVDFCRRHSPSNQPPKTPYNKIPLSSPSETIKNRPA